MFLYIGGEGPQSPVSQHLLMYQLAKAHGALIVALEHRFYGASQPVYARIAPPGGHSVASPHHRPPRAVAAWHHLGGSLRGE